MVAARIPHLPVWNAELMRCPQLPTTLPTLDELIGLDGVTADNVAERLLALTQTPRSTATATSSRCTPSSRACVLAPVFEQLARRLEGAGLRRGLDARACTKRCSRWRCRAARSAIGRGAGPQRDAARAGPRVPRRRRPRRGGVEPIRVITDSRSRSCSEKKSPTSPHPRPPATFQLSASQGPSGRPLFLSEGQHAGLHDRRRAVPRPAQAVRERRARSSSASRATP